MRRELREAVRQVAESSARTLLVPADGPDFCLGGDVREWVGLPAAELRPKIEVFAEALDELGRLEIPTLAAIQGACMGGGFELALTCIAGRSALFSCPEARLGILTLQGGMLQLADRLGPARAAELVFLSEPVSADQLWEWNTVNRVVDDAELDQAARDMAMLLATGPTRAYAATKALWRLQAQAGTGAARTQLYERSMPLFDTRDAKAHLRQPLGRSMPDGSSQG
jgi:enoyl-CoA hydratase/carnithine racemase